MCSWLQLRGRVCSQDPESLGKYINRTFPKRNFEISSISYSNQEKLCTSTPKCTLPFLTAAPIPQGPTFEEGRNAAMASARADLNMAVKFMDSAFSAADSTRATVGDIRAKGITCPVLDRAIQAADQAQKTADQARNDIENARQRLDAQAKSKPAIPGTLALIDKAMDSSFNANKNGHVAIGVLAKAPEKVAPAKIVDAHMKDAFKKHDQIVKASAASDAAWENFKKVDAAAEKASAGAKPAGSSSQGAKVGATAKPPSGNGTGSKATGGKPPRGTGSGKR